MSGPITPTEDSRLTRREVLTSAAIAAAIAGGVFTFREWRGKPKRVGPFPGKLLGPSMPVGHMLRETARRSPTTERDAGVVIVGGGIAGLSAAWRFEKKGFRDFVVVDLEAKTGGNSTWGENRVSRFPWGAHYLPLPPPERGALHEMLEDFGVIERWEKGLPVYNELHLCADPNERIFYAGVWEEGQIPNRALEDSDRREIARFMALVEALKEKRGRDGRHFFAIPVDESSTDPESRSLDEITMRAFLDREGFTSKPLRWFVDYCSRDDFGCTIDDVSAWAGLHYFASRRGRGVNGDSHTVLTWPEGNGWIVEKLSSTLGSRVLSKKMAINVENRGTKVVVDLLDVGTGEVERWRADAVVLAAPVFVRRRLDPEWRKSPPAFLESFEYAPWVVSNVTLKKRPEGDVALAWDNVSYHSDSLGYVVADHQSLKSRPRETVLTHYWPLSGSDWKSERERASRVRQSDWSIEVARDLEAMHPGISDDIESIDVWVWGHAMVRPRPGFIWGDARKRAAEKRGRIYAAHSDLSGISIFEEAFHRGIGAADEIMRS